MPNIHVHLLPSLMDSSSLSGATAVVIDVLRASTTMVHALSYGARSVIPCLTVEDALQEAAKLPADQRLLGGERGGELIPGFDLDNSPLKYTPALVRGKTVVFTTTNGTRALLESRQAARICVGAFVNRRAIVQAATAWGNDLHLVCAGTNAQLTAEDILFAGAVASDLLNSPIGNWTVGSVQTRMAADYFDARSKTQELFREAFFGSLGGQNLMRLGMQPDIERAMENDLFTGVPIWNAETGRITLHEVSEFSQS